jgi:hypothetical protein
LSRASTTSTGSGAALSMANTSAATATPNSPDASSSGRVGPNRSITRPWAIEPSETPVSAPAVTRPPAAKEPVVRCT